MRGRYLLFCIVIIFGITGTAVAQTSLNEKNGNWEAGSLWVGGTMPGTLSAGTISATLNNVIIDGTLKTQNNLSLTSSLMQINSGDTLIVFGNFIAGLSSLTNNGVLIVLGNFGNTLSNTFVSGSGKMVVTGSYTNIVGSNTFTGPAYVYGSRPSGAQSEISLATNDPVLHNYVDYIYGVLPIEFISFEATPDHDEVILSWSTASEIDNYYFLLENSVDGTTFQTVGKVSSAGNKAMNHYEFRDSNPIIGRSYYRISQVDISGKQTFYKTIKLDFNDPALLKIYPNPTADYLYVNTDLSKFSIVVLDTHGISYNESVITTLSAIDVSSLKTGVYYIKLISAEHQVSRSYRFVKQ